MKSLRVVMILAAVALVGVAQAAFAVPNCRPCPYSCADLGLGKKDCSVQSQSNNVCCLDLTPKGLDVAKAQQQVLNQQNPQANASAQRCPAGFQPSEQKCSPQERARGCKDIRLPNGQGCVSRR